MVYRVEVNILIGVLNPENYGEAVSVLSQASIQQWEAGTGLDVNGALYLPYEDKKYAADYSYGKELEEAGVQLITDYTVTDTVQDYFQIIDVQATGGSPSMQTKVTGQNVLLYDENYVCGSKIELKIKVKLKEDVVIQAKDFIDTNLGKATLTGNTTVSVDQLHTQ